MVPQCLSMWLRLTLAGKLGFSCILLDHHLRVTVSALQEGGNTSLTVVAVMSLRRSGISDLLGLLALLTIGLDGGRLWLPITLQLALREGIRPSRSSRSPVLVGLRLGCMTGMEGPPLLWRTAEHRHTETHIKNILPI